MAIILAIIGAVAGSALFDISESVAGLIAGGLIGLLTGRLITLGQRVRLLERETADLRQAGAELADRVLKHGQDQAEAEPGSRPEPAADTSGADAGPEIAAPPAPQADEPPPRVTDSISPATPSAATASAGSTFAETHAEADKKTADEWPPAPTGPAMPAWGDWLWQRIKDYFTGGNLLVRVGVIILFFGIAFLLKYAAERNVVPIELRLAGVALFAVVLLVLGWRLRTKKTAYALALQGAGIGVLYLTVFAALRLYQLLPAGAAFAVLLGIVAFSAVLAIRQDALALAVMGVSGGFLAPVLTSTGQGSHVGLFSFYAVLNAGIFAIAWFKAWRLLNVIGFVFTFVIATAWGVTRYQPEFFATTEPFLVVFFLFYVAIAVLYARRQAPRFSNYVDTTLVFGTPLVAFGLQTALVHGRPYWLAYSRASARRVLSAVGMGFIALAAAVVASTDRVVHRVRRGVHHSNGATRHGRALDRRGLGFGRCRDRLDRRAPATLAGAGVRYLFAARRRRGFFKRSGAAGRRSAGIQQRVSRLPDDRAGGVIHRLVSAARYPHPLLGWERTAAPLLFVWGLLWWLGAGLYELDRFLPTGQQISASIAFLALTAWVFSTLSQRLNWPQARWPALGLLAALTLAALYQVGVVSHPFAAYGYLAWPLALAVVYGLLYRHEQHAPEPLADGLHCAGLWLLASLGTWQLGWFIDRAVGGARTWPLIALLLVPAVTLLLITTQGRRLAWPVRAHWLLYLGVACVPLAAALVVWSLFNNLYSRGDPAPLPYVPLINPLDIAQMFALLCLVIWWRAVRQHDAIGWQRSVPVVAVYSLLGGLVFIWLNAVLLRTLHYWADVPFDFDRMWRSTLVQASFSIFWTTLALCVMLYATRSARRVLWMIGAGLMVVVVVKLFTIDISNVGGLARIVSFIAVALLMLIIGYVAPVPPRQQDQPGASAQNTGSAGESS